MEYKKICISVLILLCLSFICGFACAENKSLNCNDYISRLPISNSYNKILPAKEFILPSALTSIGDEAFEGTSISFVTIPEGTVSIGDYSFANIDNLKSVKLPEGIVHIGQGAFFGSDQVTISSQPAGYAMKLANNNQIPFIPIEPDSIFNKRETKKADLLRPRTTKDSQLADYYTNNIENAIPKGRLNGELQASRYDACSPFYIQSHSPPC